MSGIVFEGVGKRFGSVVALDGLSFAVPEGRLTGFVGPNGAGKTTSLRAMLGVTAIDSGTIDVLGMRVGPDTPRIVKRVGAIIEEPGLIPQLSGRANLAVAAATLGAGEDQIDDLLDTLDLTAAARRRAAGYSKGMRQRLGLASAMLGDPEVLVLDEPLDGLDPAGQVAFKEQLRALVGEHGKTILMSTHDLGDVEQLADHVVMIDRGRLVAQGSPAEIGGTRATVRIVIADPEGASAVLAGAGLEATRHGEALIVATADGEHVVRLLAETGRYPRAVVPQERSLEQIFLELTKGSDR